MIEIIFSTVVFTILLALTLTMLKPVFIIIWAIGSAGKALINKYGFYKVFYGCLYGGLAVGLYVYISTKII